MKPRTALLCLGLLQGFLSGSAAADSIKGFVLDIELVPEDNALQITESYLFDAEAEDILSHRTIFPAPVPGWPLVKQQVYDIEVHELDDQTDKKGRALDFEVYELPNDRIQIDFELPEDWNQTLDIAYVLSRVTQYGSDTDRIELSTWPRAWELPYEQTMLVLHLPDEDLVDKVKLKTDLWAHDEALDSESHWVENRYVEFWPEVQEPIVLDLVLELPEGTMNPGEDGAWLEAIFEAGGLPLMALLIMLPLAPVLRILPPRLSIGAAAIWNVVLGIAFCSILGPDLAFWLRAEESLNSHEWMLNALSSFVVDCLLMGAAMTLLLVQSRNLLRGHPGAWTSQLAVPMGFSVMLFFAEIVPGFLFVFLSAWLTLIFWTRRGLALQMGADLGPVVQHVLTEGEIRISALAAHFGMAPHRLSRLLRDRPGLPIATDHDTAIVYSAATLTTHSELSCCSNCGGATTIEGMEKVVCPYCEQIQATFQESEQLPPPVPHMVQTLGDLVRFLGQSVLLMGVFLMCVFGFFALGEENWMEGMLIATFCAAVGIGGGIFLMSVDESLRSGKSDTNARLILWLGSPLVLPLFALRGFGKPRVRLHFGEKELLTPLKKRLETNQQISLVEIGELLQAPYQDSAELARYLAATRQLDAVYDRQATRLVSRAAFRGMARQGSCLRCGGLLRVGPSGLACQHCGEAAEVA